MFRISTRGGMTVSAIMPTIFARGGRDSLGQVGEYRDKGGGRLEQSAEYISQHREEGLAQFHDHGDGLPQPLGKHTHEVPSAWALIVGQLSRMVPNSPSRTGVNWEPASAMNSDHTPFRLLVLFTRPPVSFMAAC